MGALRAEDVRLQRRERARDQPVAPDAPRRPQQVEVRERQPRRAHPRQRVARLEERQVKAASVKSDDGLLVVHPLRQRGQHGSFLARIAEEKLMDAKGVAVKRAEADQEHQCPGSAGKSGRLGVQKDAAAQVNICQSWLARQLRAAMCAGCSRNARSAVSPCA